MRSVVLHAGPGLDDYTLHLANALSEFARVGYCIDAYQRERFGDALNQRVTPLVFHRPRRREMWGFREMLKLSHAIEEFRPDIFHLQGDGAWEGVLLRMLGDLPVVNTVHDPVKHVDQRNWMNNTLQADAIRRSRGWVVHSDGLKRVFLERFHVDAERVLVHPHGILDYYVRFAPTPAERNKNILFFGEMRFNKGGDILLRAFDSIKEELTGWKLVLAGQGGGLTNETVMMARLGERLDFRQRFIPDEETATLFSHAGIVAIPYRHGSQSGVLALAAAFGCPVLITRIGSLPELVKDHEHALLVDPEDETALANGLLAMVADESLRTELGWNLKEHAQVKWSWKAIAQHTVGFYEELLASSRENIRA